jgi:hypothetical protein
VYSPGFDGLGYPSDVKDEEWSFVLPYLLLCREESSHREHDLREVCNAVRYVAKAGLSVARGSGRSSSLASGAPADAALAGSGML